MRVPLFNSVISPAKRLKRLQSILVPHLQTDSSFVKSWFWKENNLVFEFKTSYGAKYGIDLILTDNRFSLDVIGRDAPSRYTIRTRLGAMTRSIKKSQKRQLKTWRLPISNRDLLLEALASINRACALMSQIPSVPNRNVPAYWWDEKSNFGDQITPWLIEMMTGRPAYNTIGLPVAGQAVMAAGSIITGMNRGDMTIWGSGLISPLDDSRVDILRRRQPRRITAVRGQLTRAEIISRLGWEVPATFGDPALLLPTYFTPHSRPDSSKLPALVPHYAHRKFLPEDREENGFETVDVSKSPEIVVAQIANASSIVSTSLHGLIIAQAYGVPWIWLRVIDQELIGGDFKFKDFFSTVDESRVSAVETTANEAANLDIRNLAAQATLPQARFSPVALIDSFPYDLVPFLPGEYAQHTISRKREFAAE